MIFPASVEPEIVLDLSRLISRMRHPTPTGVDRCEMAYARGLLATVPERLYFAARHPFGVYGRLSGDAVRRFLDVTEERWCSGDFSTPWETRRFIARALAALLPRRVPAKNAKRKTIYLQASPNNLARASVVEAILRKERARFVCLLHDLIPLQYPEYARPDGAALHAHRIDTIVRFADGIITNSQATLDALTPHLVRAGGMPLTTVAHLGTESCLSPSTLKQADRSVRPYFVCIGTIEPRKNHLLLLHLWRQMAEQRGSDAVPRLLVIGRRGWENEQVVDMLERCPSLVGCVEERGTMPDREVQRLLAGAAALLLPSFAEGYGMPVTEAITLGTPVVCSDLPALHEAGGCVPRFLDPLDGPAWARTIDDLAWAQSTEALIQAERRRDWHPPSWQEHIAIVLDLLHRASA